MQLNKTVLLITPSFIFVAILLAFPRTSAAQNSSAELVVASPSFSLTDEVLQPNSKGLDVESMIAGALKKAPPVKSEYETNADYDLRLKKFGETAFSGKFSPDKKVAVIHPVSAFPTLWRGGNATIEVKYSAETEIMSVELDSWLSCLPLKRNLAPKRKYTAENGFGKKVEVIEADEAETCLELVEGGETNIKELVLSFKVKKNNAAAAKRSLGIIVIGRLAPPYAKMERQRERPTMKSPVEINKLVRSLVIKPDDVWVVNSATGRILAKQKAGFLNSDPILSEGLQSTGNCTYPNYHKSELPHFNLIVELEFLIGSNGSVLNGSVKKSTGIADLDNRAMMAISNCQFKPAMREGSPVDGVATVKFHFSDYYAGNY